MRKVLSHCSPLGLLRLLRSQWSRIAVPVVFTVFVVMRAVDRIFYKRVADRLVNYQLFFSILVPFGTQAAIMILAVPYALYMRHVEKDERYTLLNFFAYRSSCASSFGPFPQFILFMQSFYAQLGNTLTGFPTPFLGVTMIGILMNFMLVFTAFFAVVYLGTKFKSNHLAGCMLIILSSIVSCNVEMKDGSLGSYVNSHGQAALASPVWYIVFLVGTIPMGFSQVYTQKYLQLWDQDIMYASLWGGYWQCIAALMFFPCNWIPLPAPAEAQLPSQSLAYIRNGLICAMGSAPTEDPNDQLCVSDGGSAMFWFSMYLFFCTSFNVLGAWLMKYMSATWSTAGSVLCLDLSAMMSSMRWIMGPEARPMTLEQILGLALACCGMWQYSSAAEETDYAPEQEALAASTNLEASFKSKASLLSSLFNSPQRGAAAGLLSPAVSPTRTSALPAPRSAEAVWVARAEEV